MRVLALAAAGVLLFGCQSGDSTVDQRAENTDHADRATLERAPNLREVVAENAASDESIDRLGPRAVVEPEAARGGGPPPRVFWPSQARAALATARCEASCAGDRDACMARERERLAHWAVDGCERIELAGCLESVRATACEDVDWKLSKTCAPSRVCLSAAE
jgi:hypothetical protein